MKRLIELTVIFAMICFAILLLLGVYVDTVSVLNFDIVEASHET